MKARKRKFFCKRLHLRYLTGFWIRFWTWRFSHHRHTTNDNSSLSSKPLWLIRDIHLTNHYQIWGYLLETLPSYCLKARQFLSFIDFSQICYIKNLLQRLVPDTKLTKKKKQSLKKIWLWSLSVNFKDVKFNFSFLLKDL